MHHPAPKALAVVVSAILIFGSNAAPALATEATPTPTAAVEIPSTEAPSAEAPAEESIPTPEATPSIEPDATEEAVDEAPAVDAAPTPAVPELPATGISADATVAVALTGTLVVYSGRLAKQDGELGALLPDQVRVHTETGSVQLTGALVEDAVSGSSFSGIVAVPEESAESIGAAIELSRRTAVGFDAGTPAPELLAPAVQSEEVVTASADAGVALQVLSATISTPEVDAALVKKPHTIDIAIVSASSWKSKFVLSDAGVTTLTATVNRFWNSQSSGQIASITKPAAVKRITVADPCNIFATWDQAAAAFGDPSGNGYLNGGARHLSVIAPQECNAKVGLGLGSVGSLHSGGVSWAAYDAISGPETVVHELGHNLGLRHSNVHYCTGQRVESKPGTNGCRDEEYDDAYDVMGAAFVFNGTTNAQVPALNISHKARLGALSTSELLNVNRTINLGANKKTYALNPISATSGLRGLRVVDPATNEMYFIEFRSGTGIDAGALYTRKISPELVPGVRVLRVRADGSSAVLSVPNPTTPAARPFALTAGKSLTIPSGSLSFTVNSVGATASVTVSLGTGTATPAISRISGPDRYSTAVEISKAGYPKTAKVVYLATGTNYPDALGAAPAATFEGGPLLLTIPDSLPTIVANEIRRLKPSKIVVVGSTAAVSAAVFNQVKALAPSTVRLAGADRFETSRLIVEHAFRGDVPTAYIATGLNYPDALSAAGAAGAKKLPVLLVNGGASALDAATIKLLTSKKTKATIIAGAAVTVSTGVEASLRKLGTVTRIAGSDRFDTGQKLNKAAFATAPTVFIATGFQFPDALAGAALAGASKAPLYIVPSNCVPNAIANDLTTYKTTSVKLFGSASALGENVATFTRC